MRMTQFGHRGNWRLRVLRAKSQGDVTIGRCMPDTDLGHPYYQITGGQSPDWVLICDHASNRVPEDVAGGDLGLPREDMERHIAYDVGAEGLTRVMAEALSAPAILSDFSRLVIDPNRGEHDPTLLMRLYDGTIIPANRHVDAAERERRLETLHRPYHKAIARVLAGHPEAMLVSVHSFTPQLRGRAPRPWHVGLLSSEDRRLADPLIAELAREDGLIVGDNEPYSGHLPGDTMDRHGIVPGRVHVLIEVRNDLICDEAGQRAWGLRLASALTAAATSLKETSHG